MGVRQGDDARVAMDQPEVGVRDHLDPQLAVDQEVVEAPEARAGRLRQAFGLSSASLPAHRCLGRLLGRCHVLGIELGITD